MTDYKKLAEALREYSGCRKGEIARITSDAAAAIEALQAEVDALKHDIERYVQMNTDLLNAEPKRGEWYKPYGFTEKSYRRVCTNCQDIAYFCGKGNYRYCPNCGAKMGGTDASRPD